MIYSEYEDMRIHSECADMTISFVVIRCVECLAAFVFACAMVIRKEDTFWVVWAGCIFMTAFAMLASCGADIAGFVIAGDCNSYLPDGMSRWFVFGVDEFLFIGGGIHIGTLFVCCIIYFAWIYFSGTRMCRMHG